jgi:nucleotide-binding universal stress UspA family protein
VTPGIDDDVNMQLHVAPGRTTEAIADQAAAVDADLIVVGRNKRFLPWRSTAIRLLRDGDRALLIVPPTESGRATGADESTLRRAA